MSQSTPYVCNLLGEDGKPAATVQLTAATDTDAILLGNTLEHEHPQCAGFEIRAGERLVYMRKLEPMSGLRHPKAAD